MLRSRILGWVATAGLAAFAHGSAVTTLPSPARGRIAGVVVYRGEVPRPVFVAEAGADHPVILVNARNGGLRLAVVHLEAAPVGQAAEWPEVTINQRSWVFDPPVVAVREGQPVRFTNDDPSNHNVRSIHPHPQNRFNAYTGSGEPYVHRFAAPADRRPIEITCDIHHWMTAWIYVFDHPHFTLTDAEGRFRLDGLTPGPHRLTVRHPAGGLERTLWTTVQAGRTAELSVAFDASELRLSDRP